MPLFDMAITLTIEAPNAAEAMRIAAHIVECELDVEHVVRDYLEYGGATADELAAQVGISHRITAASVRAVPSGPAAIVVAP